MKLKKAMSLLLALGMIFCLAACSSGGSSESKAPSARSEAPKDDDKQSSEPAKEPSGGELISVGVINNERIYIAQCLGKCQRGKQKQMLPAKKPQINNGPAGPHLLKTGKFSLMKRTSATAYTTNKRLCHLSAKSG